MRLPWCGFGIFCLLGFGTILLVPRLRGDCAELSSACFFRQSSDFIDIRVGEDLLRVEIAETEDARQQGLSGRETIGSDGMLFVFLDVRQRSFWMKDMRFPIDILFIRDGILQEVASNLPPPLDGGNVVTYQSIEMADAVLEVPAGMVSDRGWEPGTPIFLE